MNMIDGTKGYREQREREQERMQRRLLIIRNVLNLLFMIIALVGVVWTFVGEREIGLMIVLCAIPLKMTESAIRLLKR